MCGPPQESPMSPRSSRNPGSQRFRVGVDDQASADIFLEPPPQEPESLRRIARITTSSSQNHPESLAPPPLPCWPRGAPSMLRTHGPDPRAQGGGHKHRPPGHGASFLYAIGLRISARFSARAENRAEVLSRIYSVESTQ